jgi:hypothetical protein
MYHESPRQSFWKKEHQTEVELLDRNRPKQIPFDALFPINGKNLIQTHQSLDLLKLATRKQKQPS